MVQFMQNANSVVQVQSAVNAVGMVAGAEFASRLASSTHLDSGKRPSDPTSTRRWRADRTGTYAGGSRRSEHPSGQLPCRGSLPLVPQVPAPAAVDPPAAVWARLVITGLSPRLIAV